MSWWRSYVRRKMKPVHPERAKRMRNILSGLYFFAAWNIFTVGIYKLLQHRIRGRDEEKQSPSTVSKQNKTKNNHNKIFSRYSRREKLHWLPFENSPLIVIPKRIYGYYYAKILGTGDAKVYRFKGLQLDNQYEVTGTLRPEPGRTREERLRMDKEREETEARERAERVEKWREEQIAKKKKSPDEDLGLLIEETSSL